MSRRGKRLFSIELHELDAIAKERALSEIEGPLVEGGSQEYKIFPLCGKFK
jgi:hypothetical protein